MQVKEQTKREEKRRGDKVTTRAMQCGRHVDDANQQPSPSSAINQSPGKQKVMKQNDISLFRGGHWFDSAHDSS